jgi:hypothetical protein
MAQTRGRLRAGERRSCTVRWSPRLLAWPLTWDGAGLSPAWHRAVARPGTSSRWGPVGYPRRRIRTSRRRRGRRRNRRRTSYTDSALSCAAQRALFQGQYESKLQPKPAAIPDAVWPHPEFPGPRFPAAVPTHPTSIIREAGPVRISQMSYSWEENLPEPGPCSSLGVTARPAGGIHRAW